MKRRLLIVAVFLLAGAVVNVGVAWMLAIRVTPISPSQTVPTYEGVYEGLDDSSHGRTAAARAPPAIGQNARIGYAHHFAHLEHAVEEPCPQTS